MACKWRFERTLTDKTSALIVRISTGIVSQSPLTAHTFALVVSRYKLTVSGLARDARVVLSGDTGQRASVIRGDALRILEKHSNFQSGQLTRIRRQRKAEYRKAVELAAQKRTLEAFAQLERIGAVVESSNDNLHDKAAPSYLKALNQNQTSLLVALTWNEIKVVTAKVRAALKTSGHLAGEEREFQVFDSLSWTEA